MKNVFLPTFGNRPHSIVGRDKEIAEFMSGLAGDPGHPNRATFFIGQRGMGKTALLIELAERAKKESFIPVRTLAGERMLDEIIEGIQISGARFADGLKNPVKSVDAGAFGFSAGLTFSDDINKNYGFRTKLSLLCERLAKKNKGVLFLIDEIQASTKEMREFAATYQHLVGEKANIAVAMAGLPDAISSLLNDKILTFLNRAHKVDLEALSIADVSIYYAKTFRDLGVEFDARTIDLAAEATDGYPYLLQLIGYHMIKLLEGEKILTVKLVELATINSKRAMSRDVFLPCINPLSAEDKRFLIAMSKDENGSKVSDLRSRLGVGKTHVQTYKQRLIEAGLINSTSRGFLTFSIPYIKEYLRGEL